jgi:hypothetical protein
MRKLHKPAFRVVVDEDRTTLNLCFGLCFGALLVMVGIPFWQRSRYSEFRGYDLRWTPLKVTWFPNAA